MSYIDADRRPSYSSMAAVLAIHAAVGVALITGLTVSGVIKQREIFAGIDIRKPPPPPVEPPRIEDAKPATPERDVFVPVPPLPIPQPRPTLDATPFLPVPSLPGPTPGTGSVLKLPAIPTPVPSGPALGAKPRNDPARWVGTDDYKSNWIRQEMTGKASFRLEIAADGKVIQCTITGSSGHAELDAATCALVTRRARFQPARTVGGEAVAGSYSNAIDWRLPD